MKNLRFSIFVIAFLFLTAGSYGSECNTATLITPGLSLSHKVYTRTLAGEGFSGGSQCEGPGNQPDSWVKFKAESTKMFIRATGTGDLDLAVEVFSACGSSNIACVNQSGAGASETINLTGLNVGSTYYVRSYHVGSSPATSQSYTIAASYIPTVSLRAQDCGIEDYSTNDIIRSTQPSGYIAPIEYFQWKFEELEPPFNTYEVVSPNLSNPHFRMFWFYGVEYGRSYNVSTRIAVKPGAVLGEYGPACTIKMMDNVLPTQLQAQYENAILEFCDIVAADKVETAEKYRWEFFDFSSNTTHITTGDNVQRTLRISKVPGLLLGRPYFVKVFATHKGVESPAGITRWVVMNSQVPNTGIKTDLYTCGATYPINAVLQAWEICNAESYTWRFKNLTQPSLPAIIYTRTDGNRAIRLNWINGLVEGDTYSVQIKGRQGGKNGDYSVACNITIAEGQSSNFDGGIVYARSPYHEIDEEVVANELEAALFKVNVLNNGASTGGNVEFAVVSTQELEGPSQIELYDLNGRMVANKLSYIGLNENKVAWNVPNFAPGIYLIRITNGYESQTQKVFFY